ncbi:hypothetical protein OG963_00630 [Streptomyces sp. NBC_01707]|uniref:hypothetical protein n=1 Tax=unclassified Streptomyces TaxID=2593676 RepID=UPI002E11458A|nr:hypothetical protein OG763_43810 [Streptomyces sp. NBC_01230]
MERATRGGVDVPVALVLGFNGLFYHLDDNVLGLPLGRDGTQNTGLSWVLRRP